MVKMSLQQLTSDNFHSAETLISIYIYFFHIEEDERTNSHIETLRQN